MRQTKITGGKDSVIKTRSGLLLSTGHQYRPVFQSIHIQELYEESPKKRTSYLFMQLISFYVNSKSC